MLDAKSKTKLHRLINPKSFRFIVILYEDTNDIQDTKSYIQKHFPLENTKTLETKESSYSKLSQTLYSSEYSIIYIDDFETFLKTKEIYEGFNQRRDKLAKYPINLLFFYPKSIQQELYEDALKNIPDLWEFRNGIVELADADKPKTSLEDIALKPFSSLGGFTYQAKEEEIIRLEEYLVNVQTDELKNNILNQLGRLELDLGRNEKALGYYKQSLEITVEIGNKLGEGVALNNISQIYKARGDLTKALEYLEQSLKIRVEIGDKSGEGATLNNISQIYKARGDLTKALEYLEQSLKIQVDIGDKLGEGATLNNISQIYKARGDLTKALEYLKQSLKIQVEIGDKSGEGATLNNISQIYKARGDLTKALEYLEQSLKIQVEIGNKTGEGVALNNISQIYKTRGDLTKALEYLEQSLKIRVEIGDKSGECTTLFNIGHIQLANQEQEKAFNNWLKVYEIAQEIENAQALEALDSLAKNFELENFEALREKISKVSL